MRDACSRAALDDATTQFARTGALWEFYPALDGRPEDLIRKPQTKRNLPFTDYKGPNPLLATARLWAATSPRSHLPFTS